VNFLKAGIVESDLVTTVSPRYAREITEGPEFGHGLEGVLKGRGDTLVGILNGIDTDRWNPATDPHLPAHYDERDISGKRKNKAALLARTGLDGDLDRPVIGIVSRLVMQKGVDLVLQAVPRLVQEGFALVVLGSGDALFESQFRAVASRRKDAVFYESSFDEPLAHAIQAGSDLFLMPSRYEPCGLSQMIAMRYGTVPVVRRVGGLADTVFDVEDPRGEGNGFIFEPFDLDALLGACMRALRLYREPENWRALMRRGMRAEFSWEEPARQTVKAYLRARGIHGEGC
jgi:starch synthase